MQCVGPLRVAAKFRSRFQLAILPDESLTWLCDGTDTGITQPVISLLSQPRGLFNLQLRLAVIKGSPSPWNFSAAGGGLVTTNTLQGTCAEVNENFFWFFAF